jgi:lipopolysaccharide/colanic/teichoic acid biosynthesis glycosyltransferase
MYHFATTMVETRAASRMSKRVFDVVMSAAALVVLFPFFLLLAVAIRLDTPGPTVFRQTRVGRHGETFTLFKFRTMDDGADDTVHRKAIEKAWLGKKLSDDPSSPYKLTNDKRVTKLGSWLRRTSIDELPQLVNVLRGDMSLVGPRPMIPYELANFKDWHHQRHEVLPGITGLAQINCRGRATMDEILAFDVQYVRSNSMLLDLKIIVQTIPVVFSGIGAR